MLVKLEQELNSSTAKDINMDLNEAYREAAYAKLEKTHGAGNWDMYEEEQTYIRNVVDPMYEPEDPNGGSHGYDGAWVAVLVWVDKKELNLPTENYPGAATTGTEQTNSEIRHDGSCDVFRASDNACTCGAFLKTQGVV